MCNRWQMFLSSVLTADGHVRTEWIVTLLLALRGDTSKTWKSKSLYDWQSVSMSWYRVPLWDLQPDIISCWNVAAWNLRSCFCGAPSLTRGRVCNGPSRSEPVTIFYCLIWDFPNLEGQFPAFISPRNRVAQLYPRALSLVKPETQQSLYAASVRSSARARTHAHQDYTAPQHRKPHSVLIYVCHNSSSHLAIPPQMYCSLCSNGQSSTRPFGNMFSWEVVIVLRLGNAAPNSNQQFANVGLWCVFLAPVGRIALCQGRICSRGVPGPWDCGGPYQ
jgi:hypothetical protein